MGEEEYRQMFGKSREEMMAETRAELRDAIKSGDRNRAKEISKKLKRVFVGDDVYWANEVASNIFMGVVMLLLVALLVSVIALAELGVYDFNNARLVPMALLCIAELCVGVVLVFAFHGEKSWLKYVAMLFICATIATSQMFFGYRAAICITLPMILSTKYLSEQFTRSVCTLSGILLLTSTISSAYAAVGVDLNCVALQPGATLTIVDTLEHAVDAQGVIMKDYLINLLTQNYLPNLCQFILVGYVCVTISKWGHTTILKQKEVATEFARVDTELNTARTIQENMLPRIFPAFPDRTEFDIYASMDPAKEVGGDFYDYFIIDDDHLGVVMADVSGKGVPAALFMMISKALIKNKAMTGAKPSEVLEYVNNDLCANNEMEMFVTVWLGILELSTGHLIASNAGHEYPMIRRADGDYELYKDKHGFVLAGMEDFPYKDYELDLHPGDGLFVYTDGATEATNGKQELFGTDRLLEALRRSEGEAPDAAVKKVRKEIDAFVGDAPQFDDITMLELVYYGK